MNRGKEEKGKNWKETKKEEKSEIKRRNGEWNGKYDWITRLADFS